MLQNWNLDLIIINLITPTLISPCWSWIQYVKRFSATRKTFITAFLLEKIWKDQWKWIRIYISRWWWHFVRQWNNFNYIILNCRRRDDYSLFSLLPNMMTPLMVFVLLTLNCISVRYVFFLVTCQMIKCRNLPKQMKYLIVNMITVCSLMGPVTTVIMSIIHFLSLLVREMRNLSNSCHHHYIRARLADCAFRDFYGRSGLEENIQI